MQDLFNFLAIACSLSSLIVAALSFFHKKKKDDGADGKQNGIILTELGHIKGLVEEVRAEQRQQYDTNLQLLQRLTAVEESAKQAHKRLNIITKCKED